MPQKTKSPRKQRRKLTLAVVPRPTRRRSQSVVKILGRIKKGTYYAVVFSDRNELKRTEEAAKKKKMPFWNYMQTKSAHKYFYRFARAHIIRKVKTVKKDTVLPGRSVMVEFVTKADRERIRKMTK